MSVKLPDPLLDWHQWLDWFRPELAPAVADLLRQLSPFMGVPRAQLQAGRTVFEGLGDIQRRGSYARLLGTEWLLAEEAPDEFLRRAASGEHLFLTPERHTPRSDRLLVALFDAGPLQLGAARLMHMALWILLARRAQLAGCELRWGLLQQAPALHGADTPRQLQRLLKARSYLGVSAEHLRAWQEHLETELALPMAECWLVGANATSAADLHLSSHRVSSRPSLDHRRLEVRFQEAASQRQLSLDLPPDEHGAALLKGKFLSDTAPRQKATQHRLSKTLAPLLAWDGSRVAVPLLDGPGALLLALPREDATAVKQRHHNWGSNELPLSAVIMGKTLGALFSSAENLRFWQCPGLTSSARPPRDILHAPPGLGRWLPSAWLTQKARQQFLLLDLEGNLVGWQSWLVATEKESETVVLDRNVIALAQISNTACVYLCREDELISVRRISWMGAEKKHHELGRISNVTEALIGGGIRWNQAFGGCALRLGNGPAECWRVFPPQGGINAMQAFEITLPSGATAHGLFAEDNHPAALVTLEADRKTLALHSLEGKETLHVCSSPVSKLSVCTQRGITALITQDRTLLVYSVMERALKLNMDGKGNASMDDQASASLEDKGGARHAGR